MPAINIDLKMHYDRMNAATKDRRTKYKDAPKGIPDVIYELLQPRGRVVDKTQADSLRGLNTAHCKCALSLTAQCPVRSDWEVDPHQKNAAVCAARPAVFGLASALTPRAILQVAPTHARAFASNEILVYFLSSSRALILYYSTRSTTAGSLPV